VFVHSSQHIERRGAESRHQQRAGISLKVRRTLGMRDLFLKNINIDKSPFMRAGVRNAWPTFRLSAK
jgi:hypothetical protein